MNSKCEKITKFGKNVSIYVEFWYNGFGGDYMKKNDVWKVLIISFLVVVGLSWIIPIGTFSGATFTQGSTDPVGLVDLIRIPVIAVGTFAQYGIVFVLIGGLYGVLNKTGAYTKLVDSIVIKFKGKEKNFLILTILVFALLSSLTGLQVPLFVLVPFFVATILLLGYDRITAFAVTIGSIFVGSVGSTYGFGTTGYMKYIFSTNMNMDIFARIILLIIVVFLFILLVLNKAKFYSVGNVKTEKNKGKKEEHIKSEVKEVPLYQVCQRDGKKVSTFPLIFISIIGFIFLCVGMYNWYNAFGITFFTDLHKGIMEFAINEYTLFEHLLGGITEIGYWSNYEMAIFLGFVILLFSWLYNLKLEEITDGFKYGVKEILPTASIAMLGSVVFAFMLTFQNGNLSLTIANMFSSMSDKFNVISTALYSASGSFFYNDFYYLANSLSSLIKSYDSSYYSVTSMLMGSVYSLMMLFVPTSFMLLAGLRFVGVSFKEWIHYIWKYLLEILAIIIIIGFIVLMFL